MRSLTAAVLGLMLMDPARAAVTQQFEGVITQRTLTAAAAGQGDACPAPVVELRSLVNGAAKNRAVQLGSPLPPGAGFVNDAAINRIVEANRSDVRFYEAAASAPDVDFILTLEEVIDWPRGTVTMRLEDTKGRSVLATAGIPFTQDEAMGQGNQALVSRVADPAIPLLPVIRDYQRRVRDREGSAIYARIRATPARHTLAPTEPLRVEFALVDCDEGNPPLPGRAVTVTPSGVGGIDRTAITTDDQGLGSVVFESAERGVAELFPEWRYENTAGLQTVADADLVSITVQPPFGFSRVRLVPTFQPLSSADAWYLGNLWVLADGEVDRNFPDAATHGARTAQSPACNLQLPLGAGGIVVPGGGQRRWEPEGSSGSQRAAAVIEAGFDSTQSVHLQVALSAHGKPEATWEEEGGSEVSAGASFELVVDIENPEESDYDLVVTPRSLQGTTSGSGAVMVSIVLDARGCRGHHLTEWAVNMEAAEGRTRSRRARGTRLTINGDPHVQAAFNVSATAGAAGQKLEAPFAGDAELELELEVTVVPVPKPDPAASPPVQAYQPHSRVSLSFSQIRCLAGQRPFPGAALPDEKMREGRLESLACLPIRRGE
jgi:hypothetical protein